MVPTRLEGANGLDIGQLGIAPLSEFVSYGARESILKGFNETGAKMLMTSSMIAKMIQWLISADTLVGPVGIAQIAGDTVKSSLFSFVQLMALLSISLGVLMKWQICQIFAEHSWQPLNLWICFPHWHFQIWGDYFWKSAGALTSGAWCIYIYIFRCIFRTRYSGLYILEYTVDIALRNGFCSRQGLGIPYLRNFIHYFLNSFI